MRRLSRSRGHVNFEFLKITAPTVFHQRFELGTLGSESQYSSTELNWNFYVKGGDNVLNARGRANEIGQSRCLADLLDFQWPTTGTSQRPPIDPMQTLREFVYGPKVPRGQVILSGLDLALTKYFAGNCEQDPLPTKYWAIHQPRVVG